MTPDDIDFQSQVDRFIERHCLMPTTFGRWAMDDSRFVFDLRNGRSCHLRTIRKVRKFMADYEAKQRERLKRILNLRYEDDPQARVENLDDKCA